MSIYKVTDKPFVSFSLNQAYVISYLTGSHLTSVRHKYWPENSGMNAELSPMFKLKLKVPWLITQKWQNVPVSPLCIFGTLPVAKYFPYWRLSGWILSPWTCYILVLQKFLQATQHCFLLRPPCCLFNMLDLWPRYRSCVCFFRMRHTTVLTNYKIHLKGCYKRR